MEKLIPPGLDLSKIPIGLPPTGVSPNFVNPQTLAPVILAVSAVILILTITFVILRLYSNSHAERRFGYDDCSCIVATVLLVGLTGLNINLRDYARHDYDTPLSWLVPSESKRLFAIDMIVGPSIFFAKASLLLLYYRVFAPNKLMRFLIISGIAFAFVVYILVMIPLMAYYCAPPIGHEWDLMVLKSCRRTLVFGVVQAVTNLILDLYILALPIPVVLRLQLPTRKKVGILAIFMTGLFAIVSSIISLVYRVRLLDATDVYWGVFSVQICAEVECGVAIMCSSMPALASLSRTLASHSTYYVAVRSRILSYYGKAGSKARLSKSVSSSAKPQDPLAMDRSDSGSRPYGNNRYVELSECHEKPAYESAGYGHGVQDDVEKGAVAKSVSVDASSDGDSLKEYVLSEKGNRALQQQHPASRIG